MKMRQEVMLTVSVTYIQVVGLFNEVQNEYSLSVGFCVCYISDLYPGS